MSNLPFFFLLSSTFSLLLSNTAASSSSSVGVNYGRVADNLPSPSQVAQFLTSQTTIDKVKIFDCDPQILQAFSGTGISLTVTIPNSEIISLTQLSAAQSWVSTNMLPHYAQTTIRYIAVGNEVHYTGDKVLIANLLPAMKSVYQALQLANITDIKVTTPHSLGILSLSNPPSSGRFRRGYDRVLFAPLLEFHRQTGSPFMVNPYPYFGFRPNTLHFALFKPNDGVLDKGTGLKYFNMFDAMMDAVYSAMKKLGYDDVEVAVGETGWPSAGDANEPAANWENAVSYNGNLVKHLNSGQGTPLMPNRTFETYIFSLFNEDLKPSTSERSYGLFKPDLSAVYDVGVLRSPGEAEGPTSSGMAPSPSDLNHSWCVAKSDASDEALQRNLDYVCSMGIDCKPIQEDGGPCFQPNTVRSHASYAMNSYFQINGRHDFNCYFDGTGEIISSNPSDKACEYVA